jgi:diguanylate cyclase (GGDEF)-like protein/PAS domain S-box-containing protein
MCLSIILIAIFGARDLHSADKVEFIRFLRTNVAAGLLLIILFLWFIAEYTGKRSFPVLIGVTLFIAVLFLVNLTQPYTLQYDRFDGVYQLRLPWGEVISRGNGHNGPWAYMAITTVFAIFGYAIYALVDFYRRSGRSSAGWMLFAIVLFTVCVVEGTLVRLSIVHFIALGPYGFLIMITVMGTSLSREMQEQLRASEEKFRSLFESSPAAMLAFDPDNGRIVQANQIALNMMGYRMEDILTRTIADLTPQEDLEASRNYHGQLITGSVDHVHYETRYLRNDRSSFVSDNYIAPLKEKDGKVTLLIASAVDITERKASEKKIQHLAFYDQLTDLANRRLLDDRLKQVLSASARNGRYGALLLIDLDNFKTINDSVGHHSGDLMLKQIATRLTAFVRKNDTVARLGGDEFVVLLGDLSENSMDAMVQAEAVGGKILHILSRPYRLDMKEFRSSCSIGITMFKGDQLSTEVLIKQADIAMYQAKHEGRNNLCFFDPEMQASINARAGLEGDLHKALEDRQFTLYYQLQMDDSYRPVGAEGLIRWIQPERGLISPMQFIPLAEDTGLIVPIGEWVLEAACTQLKFWRQDPFTRDLTLAINVSSKQFRKAGFIEQVQSAVRRHGVDPKLLKLELTESMLLDDIEDTIEIMNALKNIGVSFSLDDFGAGYSSLQYLKRLPLDQLKIDRSFIRDIVVDGSDNAIVRTIVAMARSLNLGVIAEGVETEAQRDLLLEIGCTHFQGYLFAKPVPASELQILFEEGCFRSKA